MSFIRPRSRRLLLWLALALCVTTVAGALLQRENIRAFLYSVTGEDELLPQARGFGHWLSGVTRPQPQTADFVPIAHNGVNPFGVNTFLNQEVEDAKVARQLDFIQEAGFKWIRQEFPWQDIEIHAKGDFQDRRNEPYRDAWAKYDRIVEQARARGIQIIARLSTPPAWSRKDGEARGAFAPPDNLNDYGDFVAAVISRYKGRVQYYQIWNEPNVYPEWGEQEISPEGYVELLKVGYARAKQADPQSVILSAPLAPTIELGPRNLNDLLFLQRMYDAGAKDYFDILSTQDYGLWSGPTDRRMRPRVLNFSRPVYIRDIMVQNGDEHKAIWASEVGWNAIPKDHPAFPNFGRATDEQVARYLPQAYERAQAEWPWMGMMAYWFFKRASDVEQGQSWYFFKMLNPNFTPMPVYEAMKRYTHQPPVIYPGYFQEDHWAISAQGDWATAEDSRAVLGRYRQSARAGDALVFTFQGSALDVVFARGPAGGMARVWVDDGAPVVVNLNSASEQFGVKTQIATGLPQGAHRVKLEVVSGVVGVDGLIVYP
ncbi:MAG: hypothetical protein HY259_07785 [Chloroflexi bacterium]|nr:hypothetical protein [Chloroflexota bacterium]